MNDDVMVFVLDTTRFAVLTEPMVRAGSIAPAASKVMS
jgi:hypothetical protein